MSKREETVKSKVLAHFSQFTSDQKRLRAIWSAIRESVELIDSGECDNLENLIAGDFSKQHQAKALEFGNELLEAWRLDYLDRPLLERMMEVSSANLEQEDY